MKYHAGYHEREDRSTCIERSLDILVSDESKMQSNTYHVIPFMFKTPRNLSPSLSLYTHTHTHTHTRIYINIYTRIYIYKLIISLLYLGRGMKLGVVKEILALPDFLLIFTWRIYSYIIFMGKIYILKNSSHSNSSFFLWAAGQYRRLPEHCT